MSNTDLLSSDAASAASAAASSATEPHAGANGTTPRKRAGLSGMVLAELRELAGELGLRGTAGMRKSDLIAAIKERQAASSGRANGRAAQAAKDQTELPVTRTATAPAEPARQEQRDGEDGGQTRTR
ncbi:MAG TPA: Rho termination factor N-terminal domain-containing protein, partial [Pseudonocardiaceae bacterium]|nr:Rho termination factor N-terminal domain-containing protein [Pseudonocardiaceae bacterium]